jgi:hypothetical protein
LFIQGKQEGRGQAESGEVLQYEVFLWAAVLSPGDPGRRLGAFGRNALRGLGGQMNSACAQHRRTTFFTQPMRQICNEAAAQLTSLSRRKSIALAGAAGESYSKPVDFWAGACGILKNRFQPLRRGHGGEMLEWTSWRPVSRIWRIRALATPGFMISSRSWPWRRARRHAAGNMFRTWSAVRARKGSVSTAILEVRKRIAEPGRFTPYTKRR